MKYPVIIVECTSFPDHHSEEQMNKIKHTHFNNLYEIILEHKEKQWILIHTSMAIKEDYLEALNDKFKSEGLNVLFYGH